MSEDIANATRIARRQRAEQAREQGWPEDDCAAFLNGARDHWPSMQASVAHLLARENGGAK
jgi:hypothetical protein